MEKKKRATPLKHWEIKYNADAPSPAMKAHCGADFMPKRSSERATTHLKINKEDH